MLGYRTLTKKASLLDCTLDCTLDFTLDCTLDVTSKYGCPLARCWGTGLEPKIKVTTEHPVAAGYKDLLKVKRGG